MPALKMKWLIPSLLTTLLLGLCGTTSAQHLHWNLNGQKDATCLYGEITVLATNPHIYYCGANWHPGEPAGGYCGIQHNSENERRTIFSIWDTSPELHPQVTEADARTLISRFGGEGTGAHTHMMWPWKIGQKFQFFVQKEPGAAAETTDTLYYIYDPDLKKWIHSATITSPDGGKPSVGTIGGGLNSFLENFAYKDRAAPKLALYSVWLGTKVDSMQYLTRAGGDGIWGQLHDRYFLAEGDASQLHVIFAQVQKEYGDPIFGERGKTLGPISNNPLSAEVIAALKHLPHAEKVAETGGSGRKP